MLTLKECKNILNKNEGNYSNEEIERIKAMLYKLAEIDYEELTEKRIDDESYYIRKGINR